MHPDDSAWRALLDGELAPVVAAELEQHLGNCPVCKVSTSAIAGDRTRVRGLLSLLGGSIPVPNVDDVLARAKRPTSRRWALLAAMILLGMVTVAGATIATRWFRTSAGAVQRSQPTTPVGKRFPQADSPVSTGISLEAGDTAEIVFLSSQAAGTLTIMEGDGSNVEVVATGFVPYTVRNGRVTITNEGTNADYQITIPRRLLRAEVRVADRVLFAKRGPLISAAVKPESAGIYLLPFP
ncbi:MAG: zf-HC2 domain-containing protein [Gemmatimonadota bacterium]